MAIKYTTILVGLVGFAAGALCNSTKFLEQIFEVKRFLKSLVLRQKRITGTAAAADQDGVDVEYRILRRAETVLKHRIGDVIIILERISDSHNYTAILRTCEALGYQNVFVVSVKERVKEMGEDRKRSSGLKDSKQWAHEDREHKMHMAFGRGAYKWLSVREFDSVFTCIEYLKKQQYEIWCTDLSQKAVSFDFTIRDSIPVPRKLAVVIGTESTGVSQAFVDACQKRIFLPMNGFADSLNASVAAAIVMQQLIWMKPKLIGSLSGEEIKLLREKWYRTLARNPTQAEQYMNMLDSPPEPFMDTRRADEHRSGWTKKKDKAKEVNAHEYTPGR
mmetsp:Transcript_20227/g.26257  ORF Transcript_20227/g.26257 Transcript_20227/m.26257 type:complete len:333 (-) Transcript_20227:1754-2752(-)